MRRGRGPRPGPRRCAARRRPRLRHLAGRPPERGLRRRRQRRRHLAQRLHRAVQQERRRGRPHRLAGAVLVRGRRCRRPAERHHVPDRDASPPAATTWCRRRPAATPAPRPCPPPMRPAPSPCPAPPAGSPSWTRPAPWWTCSAGAASAVAEGSPAASTTNTTSATRNNTCVDTDDNAADFAAVSPDPAATPATPHEDCVAPPPVARPDHRRDPGLGTPVAAGRQAGRRRAGRRHRARPQGFWMQSATPDADPGTSEGIYVFTRTAPTVAVGDAVTVSGTVTEFRPGGAPATTTLTTTEIVSPVVTTTGVGHGAARARRRSGSTGSPHSRPSRRATRSTSSTTEAIYRPATDAIDFYESLEGMRVGLRDAEVVGPTPRSARSRWSRARAWPPPGPRTAASSTAATTSPTPPGSARRLAAAGGVDALGRRRRLVSPGDTVGVVDYSFSNYKLELTSVAGPRPRRPAARGHRDARATTTSPSRRSTSRTWRRTTRRRSSTAWPGRSCTTCRARTSWRWRRSRTTAAPATTAPWTPPRRSAKLTAAIRAAGGPAYEARWINPTDGTDGGQPGGNIRQVFLFRPDRGCRFVDRPGGTATTATTVVADGAPAAPVLLPRPDRPDQLGLGRLRASRSRASSASAARRCSPSPTTSPPRAATTRCSAAGSSRCAPRRCSGSEQATEVRGFVDQILAADAHGRTWSCSGTSTTSTSARRSTPCSGPRAGTAWSTCPGRCRRAERYTYVFEGNSQVLDHILLSPGLATRSRAAAAGVRLRPRAHQLRVPRPGQRPRPAGRAAGDPPRAGLTGRAGLRRADGARRAGTIARRALLCPA